MELSERGVSLHGPLPRQHVNDKPGQLYGAFLGEVSRDPEMGLCGSADLDCAAVGSHRARVERIDDVVAVTLDDDLRGVGQVRRIDAPREAAHAACGHFALVALACLGVCKDDFWASVGVHNGGSRYFLCPQL